MVKGSELTPSQRAALAALSRHRKCRYSNRTASWCIHRRTADWLLERGLAGWADPWMKTIELTSKGAALAMLEEKRNSALDERIRELRTLAAEVQDQVSESNPD